MDSPLEGINEKLKRAEANILNLYLRVNSFLDSGEHRTIPYPDLKGFCDALKYHSTRSVPVEFSILAGEVIYQLRSSLDHLVWQLVLANGRKPTTRSEFPIFEVKPSEKFVAQGFGGKIKGISPSAAAAIKGLQPYQSGIKASNEPLWILHDLSRIDKHHELLLVVGTIKLNLQHGGIYVHDGPAELLPKLFGFKSNVDVHQKLAPTISFVKFGSDQKRPLIEGLVFLWANVRKIIRDFSKEFPR
jgi:hypothetical protein